MASISHLIIGLGNYGDEYARTRHNIGFMAVDEVAIRYSASTWKKKFRGLIATAENFLLLKPQTYMNLSGESAIEALNFYQLKAEQVIVFHDDLDLLPGQVKIKQGGGAGGHNGLKSLDAHIGPDYWRVRLGIGRPMTEQGETVKGDAVTHYVLNPFAKADRIWLEPLIEALAKEFDKALKGNYTGYAASLPKG
jgi:peptidyl-tRNA hydrolase, PTH1 family